MILIIFKIDMIDRELVLKIFDGLFAELTGYDINQLLRTIRIGKHLFLHIAAEALTVSKIDIF